MHLLPSITYTPIQIIVLGLFVLFRNGRSLITLFILVGDYSFNVTVLNLRFPTNRQTQLRYGEVVRKFEVGLGIGERLGDFVLCFVGVLVEGIGGNEHVENFLHELYKPTNASRVSTCWRFSLRFVLVLL